MDAGKCPRCKNDTFESVDLGLGMSVDRCANCKSVYTDEELKAIEDGSYKSRAHDTYDKSMKGLI